MTTAERITWALSAAVFLPALIVGGGFFIAIGGAMLILLGHYGGRYGLRIYEQRNLGAKGSRDFNQIISGGSDDDRRRR